jgi:hypothetical protein
MDCLGIFGGLFAFRPAHVSPTWSPARPLRTEPPRYKLAAESAAIGTSLAGGPQETPCGYVGAPDAQELAELSASIPADVKLVNRGLLPKDLVEKLKRVEKLSKHLRSELTR